MFGKLATESRSEMSRKLRFVIGSLALALAYSQGFVLAILSKGEWRDYGFAAALAVMLACATCLFLLNIYVWLRPKIKGST